MIGVMCWFLNTLHLLLSLLPVAVPATSPAIAFCAGPSSSAYRPVASHGRFGWSLNEEGRLQFRFASSERRLLRRDRLLPRSAVYGRSGHLRYSGVSVYCLSCLPTGRWRIHAITST